MGTAPSMAKGTTSVEPASGAEKAATAKPEALEPREYGGGAGNGCRPGTGVGREQAWAGNGCGQGTGVGQGTGTGQGTGAGLGMGAAF